MAYQRQNFIDGAVLTANNLNLMEDGIVAKQEVSNLTTTLDENSDHTHYPSAKAVYDFAVERLADSSLELGTTSSTAYYGDKGQIAYDHSQITSGNPHGITKFDLGLGDVENKSSEIIRNEITKENITTALGYTPSEQDTVYTHPDTHPVEMITGLSEVAISGDYNDLLNKPPDYMLPSAGENLGGVKTGGNVTIENGVITVNDNSHNHTIDNIYGATDALSGLQPKTDETLETESKEIVDAINEINSKVGANTPNFVAGNNIEFEPDEDGETVMVKLADSITLKGSYPLALSKGTEESRYGCFINPPTLTESNIDLRIQSKSGTIALLSDLEGLGVPSCDSSNEGQFLRVINGVPAWSSVLNAEDYTF